MGPLRPAPDRYDFRDTDRLVAFAEQYDVAVHGHSLVWHRQLPDWLEEREWTRDELLPLLRDHVRTVVGRYRGRVASWDVVNEPLAEDGSGLRDNVWLRVIGPEYIELALAWAHEADPDARLYLNEYGAELPGVKADSYHALAAGLLERGAPLDVVGFEAHLLQHAVPDDLDVQFGRTLRRFAELGLATDVSELDVVQSSVPGGRGRFHQADVYRAVASACRDADRCGRLTTWGFSDRHSWLRGTGRTPAPLPLDCAYQPKPAHDAVREVLGERRHSPWTRGRAGGLPRTCAATPADRGRP